MAKRSAARKSNVIQFPRAAAPARPVIVRETRIIKPKHRRRHGSGGKGIQGEMTTGAIAGFVLGYLDKKGTTFPTIAVLGRAGSLAAICYFMRSTTIAGVNLGKLAPHFAAIAAYEFESQGSISGF